MSQPKISAKQQRWWDFIADFSIDVQYQPGKQNIFLDTLSPQPAPPIDVSSCNNEKLALMILEPSWLVKIHQG